MDGEPGASTTDAALRVFAYAGAEKSATYVAIAEALMEAKERFQLQLRPAEVDRHLNAATIEEISALESLFEWATSAASTTRPHRRRSTSSTPSGSCTS